MTPSLRWLQRLTSLAHLAFLLHKLSASSLCRSKRPSCSELDFMLLGILRLSVWKISGYRGSMCTYLKERNLSQESDRSKLSRVFSILAHKSSRTKTSYTGCAHLLRPCRVSHEHKTGCSQSPRLRLRGPRFCA